MSTLRERTSIPVPQIFGFNALPSEKFDYPYVLMEHVTGKPLGGILAKEVPSKYVEKAAKQLASVLFQLKNLTFDHLGRI